MKGEARKIKVKTSSETKLEEISHSEIPLRAHDPFGETRQDSHLKRDKQECAAVCGLHEVTVPNSKLLEGIKITLNWNGHEKIYAVECENAEYLFLQFKGYIIWYI